MAEGDKSYGYGVYKIMVRMQGHRSKQFQTTTSSNHYQVVAAAFRDLLCVVPACWICTVLGLPCPINGTTQIAGWQAGKPAIIAETPTARHGFKFMLVFFIWNLCAESCSKYSHKKGL